MTPKQLAEIKARWEKATPNLWLICKEMLCSRFSITNLTENDYKAIASAPTDIALLLAEVRRLRELETIIKQSLCEMSEYKSCLVVEHCIVRQLCKAYYAKAALEEG